MRYLLHSIIAFVKQVIEHKIDMKIEIIYQIIEIVIGCQNPNFVRVHYILR